MRMHRFRQKGTRAAAWLILGFTLVVLFLPDHIAGIPKREAKSFSPPSWKSKSTEVGGYFLGTDYLGRPFVPVLASAISETAQVALLGTAAVLIGVLIVGTIHGSTRSRILGSLVAAGNLGVMAVPEVAVLITMTAAWPRTAPAALVNASMVSILVFFAIPSGARLIAERVRAVNQTGFVLASRACGASTAYTFRHDVWPHLVEDMAWITASVLPRFVAAEVGLAYLGVEYREFDGLGRTLAKSFNNLTDDTARLQMLVTIGAILWIAFIPQILLHALGQRALQRDAL